jgi:hypothetical protein
MSSSINKGHENQFSLLLNSIKKGGQPIIPIEDIFNATKASFGAIESLISGNWINVD